MSGSTGAAAGAHYIGDRARHGCNKHKEPTRVLSRAMPPAHALPERRFVTSRHITVGARDPFHVAPELMVEVAGTDPSGLPIGDAADDEEEGGQGEEADAANATSAVANAEASRAANA